MSMFKKGEWVEVVDGGIYGITKEGSIGVIVSDPLYGFEHDDDYTLIDVRFYYVTGRQLFGRAGEYTDRTFSIMLKNLKVIDELEAKKKIARGML